MHTHVLTCLLVFYGFVLVFYRFAIHIQFSQCKFYLKVGSPESVMHACVNVNCRASERRAKEACLCSALLDLF